MTHINYTLADRQFLAEVTAYIERYASKQVITLAMIGDSLQMSHDAIHHKIRLLTGLSGSEYILKVRLQHSLHQMLHEHRNVSEAASENGFKDVSYFRNCFKDEFGMTPAEYLDRQQHRGITNLKKTIKTMKQRLIAMLLSLPLAVSVVQAQPITAGHPPMQRLRATGTLQRVDRHHHDSRQQVRATKASRPRTDADEPQHLVN